MQHLARTCACRGTSLIAIQRLGQVRCQHAGTLSPLQNPHKQHSIGHKINFDCKSSRQVAAAALQTGEDIEIDMMERMEKCIVSVQRSFSSIRTGRASPDMLDRVMVDYYGAPTPLRQLAGISVPESSMLVVQPYDKGSMQVIEKAIQLSDLGLPPNNDGKIIRLNIPPLTQERRKDFSKQASKLAEEGKIAIRNVRRDGMTAIKQLKGDGMSEDEAKALEDMVQEQTDDFVKEIDKLLKKKQDELIKV